MYFQEMKYVYEVYRQRSFTKAAQALFIAQPSLSQMVRKAEERIGGPIFDRSTMPIGITERGLAYIRSAEEIMRVNQEFESFLNQEEQCLTGSLTLGGTSLFNVCVLSSLISAYSARYPAVSVHLDEEPSAQSRQHLQDGTLDLAVDNGLFDPNIFASRVYRREQVILALPVSADVPSPVRNRGITAEEIHAGRLPSAGPVFLSAVRSLPFLLLKEGNDTRERADQMFREAGFDPVIRLQLDQQLTAYHMAACGLGAAFISDTLVMNMPPDDRLLFFRIDSRLVFRDISFFYKKNRPLSAPVKAFLQMLQAG